MRALLRQWSEKIASGCSETPRLKSLQGMREVGLRGLTMVRPGGAVTSALCLTVLRRAVAAILACCMVGISIPCHADPGSLIWMSGMPPGSPPGSAAAGMALDSHNNIYVAGSVINPNGYGLDIALVKYSISGKPQWIRTYNGPANGDDFATGVAVDSQDNVVVTGVSYGGAATGNDIVTINWSSSGWQNWAMRYDGPVHGDDGSSALCTDSTGSTLVTGWTQVTANQWEAVNTVATAVTVDSVGNTSITGYTWAGSAGLMDYATAQYNINGKLAWARVYSGTGNDWDVPVAIGIDPAQNVYVTGSSLSASGYGGIATIKYSPAGSVVWTRRYDPTMTASIQASALSVQPDGTTYVTGCAQGGYDAAGYPLASILTIQYNPDGTLGWTNSYQPTGDSYASPNAIAVDPLGEVFVSGWELIMRGGATYTSQGITMKINSAGATAWATPGTTSGSAEGWQDAIALSHAGYVVSAGQFGSGWTVNGVPEFNWEVFCYVP